MQQVAVHRVRLGGRGGHRDAVRFGVGDHFRAARETVAELAEPPGSDHGDFRRQRRRRELEAHLVVALARSAVSDRRRAFGPRDLHHPLRDQRTGDARAEQILPLVERPGLEHRVDEVLGELLAKVIDVHFGSSGGQRFFLQPVQLFLLSDIRRKGDDFRVVCLF
ncbi:hypothetical protein D1872_226810 [compost metagenome]